MEIEKARMKVAGVTKTSSVALKVITAALVMAYLLVKLTERNLVASKVIMMEVMMAHLSAKLTEKNLA